MKWRFANWELWLVFGVAFALRLIFTWQWQALPYALSPFLDAKSYQDWALAIANGEFLRETAFYQSPLYSYFLALIYKVAGVSALTISLVQAFLGAATCGLIALLTNRHFGKRSGLEAGLLAAMESTLIFYSAPLLKETLMLFCLTLFVFFALESLDDNRRSNIWAGLSLGAAVLLRGNLLLLGPAFVVLSAWRFRLRAWSSIAKFTLATVFVMAPAVLHNWKATSGDFVLTTYNGGFNFYIGNWPGASGANTYPPQVSTDALQEEVDTKRIAEEKSGRTLRPSEVSRFWFQEGKIWALENPSRWLSVVAHKFWFFWNDHEIADNYDSEFLKREGGTILSWPLVSFGFVVLFAIFGFEIVTRSSIQMQALFAFTFTYMMSALLFYVTDRYRLPVVIFLLPAAGVGTTCLTEMVQRRAWRAIVRAALPVIPFAALCFVPLPSEMQVSDAYNWGLQASLYSDAGRYAEAVVTIEKALADSPTSVPPQFYIKASTSYERLGNLAQAEALLERAAELYPNDGLTHFNLGRFRYEHGRLDSALELYNRALLVAPYLFEPYIGLGVLYFARGDYGLARESVARGLTLNSKSPELLELQRRLESLPTAK